MQKIEVQKIGQMTGHSGSVYTLENGVESHQVFSGSSDKFVTLWNIKNLSSEKFAAQFPDIIYSICHIPERKLLLAGTSSGKIHILDLEKKQEVKILAHHTGPVFDIKYSLPTNSFFSVSGDGAFVKCSLENLAAEKIIKLCNEKVRSIDVSKTKIAVACGDGTVRIFDLNSLAATNNFTAHKMAVNVVKFHSSGKFLFSGGKDAHLNIWDDKYELVISIPAHNYAIYSIVFSPDGKFFATASRDKTFKIWDAKTFDLLLRVNKEKYDAHINSVNKLLWTNYNDYLISTGDDRAVMVWKIIP